MEEKAFAVISKDSVKLMGENAGISNVLDDVAAVLGEDVSYRLREVVTRSTLLIKSAKRRRLGPEDFNEALKEMNAEPVYGHNSATDSSPFRQTREGELHFVEDNDINFSNVVCNSYVPKSLGRASTKAQWMAVEGTNKFSSSSSHLTAHIQSVSKSVKKESSAESVGYYSQITKMLVGCKPFLVKQALADLAENNLVQSSVSYFANFVAKGVKAVSHDVPKLLMLMKTTASLIENKTLDLELEPHLHMLVQAVEMCLLEPQTAYINQQTVSHWMLRRYAAGVLVNIVRKWGSRVNRLQAKVTARLRDALKDTSLPPCSHYGAVVGLQAFGPAEVERVVVSMLPDLMSLIDANVNSETQPVQSDAMQLWGAVRMAMESLLKTYMNSDDLREPGSSKKKSAGSSSASVCQDGLEILNLYRLLCDYFGDSLIATLPIMNTDHVFYSQPSSNLISLGDSDSKRSGEELLADLMKQVQQEQEEEQRRQARQRQAEKQKLTSLFPAQPQNELIDIAALLSPRHDRANNGNDVEPGPGFQEQLAVSSSTISDPSKGTLKLKIKRHTQGQGSPSQSRLMQQLNKGWADVAADSQSQSRDSREKEHRLQRKRKQSRRNPWDQNLDLELSDVEDTYSHPMLSLTPQAYSPGGDSSGSDSSLHRKGKLMLKLKVPSRDSPSE